MLLTTLANVKQWIPQMSNDATDDSLLNNLISRCSSHILAALMRPDLTMTTFTDYFDGVPPSGRVMLSNWPVLSVSSVSVNSNTIPQASSPGQPGWALERWNGSLPGVPQRVGISGYIAPQGAINVGYNSQGFQVASFGGLGNPSFQNTAITYVAGYVVQNEAQSVPAAVAYTITPLAPYGLWAKDEGVTYANGTALVAVSGTPGPGQYVPPDPWATVPTSVYTFNVADAGADVLLTYSFVPAALEQATIEWVAERYRYRDRIGLVSAGLSGQESTTYQMGIPEAIKLMIQPYVKEFPL